jgi:hypothetical protein
MIQRLTTELFRVFAEIGYYCCAGGATGSEDQRLWIVGTG